MNALPEELQTIRELKALLIDSARKFEVIHMTLLTENLSINDLRELRSIAEQGDLAIESAIGSQP